MDVSRSSSESADLHGNNGKGLYEDATLRYSRRRASFVLGSWFPNSHHFNPAQVFNQECCDREAETEARRTKQEESQGYIVS